MNRTCSVQSVWAAMGVALGSQTGTDAAELVLQKFLSHNGSYLPRFFWIHSHLLIIHGCVGSIKKRAVKPALFPTVSTTRQTNEYQSSDVVEVPSPKTTAVKPRYTFRKNTFSYEPIQDSGTDRVSRQSLWQKVSLYNITLPNYGHTSFGMGGFLANGCAGITNGKHKFTNGNA